MSDDIVDTLRRNPLYIPTSRINSFGRPQMGFELTSFNLIAADEIERLRKERDEAEPLLNELWDRRTDATEMRAEIERLRKERDEARLRTNSILTEIDCRIEHGAESNGHLEGIRNLFKNKK